MGARVEKITRPEDLDLPKEAIDVFAALTPKGAETFSREIVEALLKAQRKGNLRPIKDVVDAWYRSLLLVRDPTHLEAVAWAKKTRKRTGISLDELKERFNPS